MSAPSNEIQQRLDLLNQTHAFPTRVMFKVIGENRASFVEEVVSLVRRESSADETPPYSTREARGGRHIAITLEPQLNDAERVLSIYARLKVIPGVVLLL